jgi:hypothetical protein
MAVFVGERYIAGAARMVALLQAEQMSLAVQRMASEGSPVTLLSTTFVPNEEWVFDVFRAESVEQVRAVYTAGGIPVERVTEGVHLLGPPGPKRAAPSKEL